MVMIGLLALLLGKQRHLRSPANGMGSRAREGSGGIVGQDGGCSCLSASLLSWNLQPAFVLLLSTVSFSSYVSSSHLVAFILYFQQEDWAVCLCASFPSYRRFQSPTAGLTSKD